jgi:hypothetical protein
MEGKSKSRNAMGERSAMLLHIRGVSGSNLVMETGYHD